MTDGSRSACARLPEASLSSPSLSGTVAAASSRRAAPAIRSRAAACIEHGHEQT